MGEKSVTSHDLTLLREILALTRPGREGDPGPEETAFTVLELLEDLLHSDFVSFQEMHVGPHKSFTRYYCQGTEGGERSVLGARALAEYDRENPPDVLEEYWWQLPCSLVDRTGMTQLTSLRMFFSEREWAVHPVHLDYLTLVDEILLAFPAGGGRSLRILTGREERPSFGPRELTLMELLQPHLRPLLEAVLAQAGTPGSRPGTPTRLTARQLEILHLVGLGMPNKQVGRQLGISEGTVRKHLENAYERIGAQSRTEAVFWVRERELAAV